MSWTSFGGTSSSDFASWATTGRSPTARTTSAGPPASPVRTTSSQAAPKRHGPSTPNSSPSGTSGGATASVSSSIGQRAEVDEGALADLGADRGGRHAGRRGLVLAEHLLQAAQRVAQLELAEDVAQPGAIRLRRRLGGDVDVHRDVAPDRRELLRHARQVGVLGEVLLALGARDVVDVREHALEVAPLLQELRRGLVADAGDAGDVVARVALEPVEVGDELGRDAVALDDRLVVVHLRLGDPAARRHDLHDAVGVDELERVAVAGDDDRRDRRIRLTGALGDRGDDVVGLEAVDVHVAVAEGLDERLEVRPLLAEQRRALRAAGLVLRVDLLAAGRPGVPHHDGRLRPVVGEDLHEHRRESEDRVGREPRRRRDRLGQGEERPVHERVAVDEVELVGTRRHRAVDPSGSSYVPSSNDPARRRAEHAGDVDGRDGWHRSGDWRRRSSPAATR